jgi:hypothetical protein
LAKWQQNFACLWLHDAEVAVLREVNRWDHTRLLDEGHRLSAQGEVGGLAGAAVLLAALAVGKL